MSGFQGTPGPWEIEGTEIRASRSHASERICDMAPGFEAADAALIAAAPDLLDCLQRLLWTRTQERGLQYAKPGDSPLHDRCIAAIIKAGGRVL